METTVVSCGVHTHNTPTQRAAADAAKENKLINIFCCVDFVYGSPCSLFQADLIHLGAKFSPCMRLDSNVDTALRLDRAEENKTACCVYNDGSGCLQSSRAKCPVGGAKVNAFLAQGFYDMKSSCMHASSPQQAKCPVSLCPSSQGTAFHVH